MPGGREQLGRGKDRAGTLPAPETRQTRRCQGTGVAPGAPLLRPGKLCGGSLSEKQLQRGWARGRAREVSPVRLPLRGLQHQARCPKRLQQQLRKRYKKASRPTEHAQFAREFVYEAQLSPRVSFGALHNDCPRRGMFNVGPWGRVGPNGIATRRYPDDVICGRGAAGRRTALLAPPRPAYDDSRIVWGGCGDA
jgi:hypothetical protein